MKRFLQLTGSFLLVCPAIVWAANAPTDLPNISVAGHFLGTMSQKQAPQFGVNEIELAIQHYVYPSVHADIFTAFSRSESGESEASVEEAYLTFSDWFGVWVPDADLPIFEAIVGRKKLQIGKWNALHPEQLPFADSPLTQQILMHGEEGLSGDGLQITALLPLPFFSRFTIGEWAVSESEEAAGPGYGNPVLALRSWNGIGLSENTEFELGLSGVLGGINQSESDSQSLWGADVTLTHTLGNKQFIKVVGEWYRSDYATEESVDRLARLGTSITALYQPNGYFQLGGRYDWVGKHIESDEEQRVLALFATRMLSDTAKMRLQTNIDQNQDLTVLLQLVFVLGPHAHDIQ